MTPRELWSDAPTETRPAKSAGEVLIEHTSVRADGCWVWIASRTSGGYGKAWRAGRTVLAHRLAYETTHGPIPSGMQLDHLCRNRACVNPSHLEPVTARVNTLRGTSGAAQNAVKTHCPQGHAYDETNTGRNAGSRYCKPCQAAHARRYRAARRAQGAPS